MAQATSWTEAWTQGLLSSSERNPYHTLMDEKNLLLQDTVYLMQSPEKCEIQFYIVSDREEQQ